MNAASKTITYDIKTEKKFVKKGKSILPIDKKNKAARAISDKEYKQQKSIAKLNLTEWTKILLWGDQTIVKTVIDGTEIR
jgi:hypothetical protein